MYLSLQVNKDGATDLSKKEANSDTKVPLYYCVQVKDQIYLIKIQIFVIIFRHVCVFVSVYNFLMNLFANMKAIYDLYLVLYYE